MKAYWVACLNEHQRFALASRRLFSYADAEAIAAKLDILSVPVIIIR